MKSPSFSDHLYSYIERQLAHVVADIDRKLTLKVDKSSAQDTLTVDENIRSLRNSLQDLRNASNKYVLKDDFLSFLNGKAEQRDVAAIQQSLLKDTVNRHDMIHYVNSQVGPIITSMSSLDKALHIEESNKKKTNQIILDRLRALSQSHSEILNSGIAQLLNKADFSDERIQKILEDVIKEKKIGEVNKLLLDGALNDQTEVRLNILIKHPYFPTDTTVLNI